MAWNRRVPLLALAAVVLIAGASLCLLVLDEHQGSAVDLCLSLVAVITAATLGPIFFSTPHLAPATLGAGARPTFEPAAPPPKA